MVKLVGKILDLFFKDHRDKWYSSVLSWGKTRESLKAMNFNPLFLEEYEKGTDVAHPSKCYQLFKFLAKLDFGCDKSFWNDYYNGTFGKNENSENSWKERERGKKSILVTMCLLP